MPFCFRGRFTADRAVRQRPHHADRPRQLQARRTSRAGRDDHRGLIVVSPKAILGGEGGESPYSTSSDAINLALGSCALAMGTHPCQSVLGIGIVTGKTVIMGVDSSGVIMLALTLVLSALTFSGTHTTLLEGAAHLAVFFIYIVLMFSP